MEQQLTFTVLIHVTVIYRILTGPLDQHYVIQNHVPLYVMKVLSQQHVDQLSRLVMKSPFTKIVTTVVNQWSLLMKKTVQNGFHKVFVSQKDIQSPSTTSVGTLVVLPHSQQTKIVCQITDYSYQKPMITPNKLRNPISLHMLKLLTYELVI